MKAQLIIYGIALMGCLFVIQGFGRVSDQLVSASDGAQILAAIDEELELRGFGEEAFPEIDGRAVIVSENIAESWWRDARSLSWSFRPISDEELDGPLNETKTALSLIHVERRDDDPAGHPMFGIRKVRYYRDNGILFKRFIGDRIDVAVVKLANGWRAVSISPTATNCVPVYD